MDKQWCLLEPDDNLAKNFSEQLQIAPLLARVLVNRGIKQIVSATRFLNPQISDLIDPFDIPDIRQAAERGLLAKQTGKKVVVFGDYDVDGVSATAIMLETLRFLGLDATYYIPHRYEEGYGLSDGALAEIAAAGAGLVITVDCGVSNFAEVKKAQELGLEIIVTDHHNLPARLPDCLVINPKLIKGPHPSSELSGAGVAFKFAWALLRTAGIKDSQFLVSLLDLAALGTLADVVPLREENRVIAVLGLRVINERQRLGLRALIEAASLPEHITVNNIYFGLAPRINAAGRLEHASKSVDLMLTKDLARARALANELNRINVRRQDIGEEIRQQVFERLTDAYLASNKLVVIEGAAWHPGVVGIIASKVVDHCFRPAVLVGINEGQGRGSARSIDGVDIFALLNNCADLFDHFGGHKGAAGFSIRLENIAPLKERLAELAEQYISEATLTARLKIEAEVMPEQLNLNLVRQLEKLEPYGEANPQPIFMSRGLRIIDMRQVGADGRHFKAKFCNNEISLETIAFSKGAWVDELSYDKVYDLVYRLEANEWNGFESVQLSLIDIREALK